MFRGKNLSATSRGIENAYQETISGGVNPMKPRSIRDPWQLISLLFSLLLIPLPEVAAIPAAPSGLRVGGFPGGQIQLAWTDNSGDETTFQVERSAYNRNGYTPLISLPANSTQYTDAAVSVDTTYWFLCRKFTAQSGRALHALPC
jgi:hypothetical protein